MNLLTAVSLQFGVGDAHFYASQNREIRCGRGR
jgi:hypothetical protein